MRWRRVTWLGLACGSAACARPPAAEPSAPATVAIAPAARAEDAPTVPQAREARDFLGLLVNNEALSMRAPLEICLDDGKLYRASPFRLGRTNLGGSVALRREDAGSIVLATGRERPLRGLLTVAGACGPDYGTGAPEVQMRSDQVSPEGGFRSTWAAVAALTYIEAQQARVVRVHEIVRQDADTVTVRLQSPFDYPIRDLEVAAHYEGGLGKSMPKLEAQTLTLPGHGSVELTWPRRVSEEWKLAGGVSRRAWYELESVELRLDQPRVFIEATLVLDLH